MNAGMHCTYVSVSSDGLDLVVVDEMDGRTRYLLRYGMVRYGTVLPLGGERDACMYACVRACTCAVLGWAVLCWAVLCGACAVRCWLHCRSLMKKKDESKG